MNTLKQNKFLKHRFSEVEGEFSLKGVHFRSGHQFLYAQNMRTCLSSAFKFPFIHFGLAY